MYKKPRLIFVINVDWFFISHRLPIAIEAIKRGYEVHIATAITDHRATLEDHGLIVHPLDINRSKEGFFDLLFTIRQILTVIKSVKPDIIHLVTIKPVLLGGIAARLAKAPHVVIAISGLGSVYSIKGGKRSIRRIFVGMLYCLALKQKKLTIIFQNPNDKSRLIDLVGISEQQTKMIYGSGVDLDRFQNHKVENDIPIIMFASRLLYEKGVREFVQAAQMLIDSSSGTDRPARFVLVGSPDLDNPSSVTEQVIKKWVDAEIIEYWGQRQDMPQVLTEADIVVLPSYYGEGLPKILIEAAASGCAVITTDHPGCRDAIKANITGLLVPIRDVLSLAEAMQELLNDNERRKSMGLEGRKLAEHKFDIKKVIAEHIKIYESHIDPN